VHKKAMQGGGGRCLFFPVVIGGRGGGITTHPTTVTVNVPIFRPVQCRVEIPGAPLGPPHGAPPAINDIRGVLGTAVNVQGGAHRSPAPLFVLQHT